MSLKRYFLYHQEGYNYKKYQKILANTVLARVLQVLQIPKKSELNICDLQNFVCAY